MFPREKSSCERPSKRRASFLGSEIESAVVLIRVVRGERSFMHQIPPKKRSKMVQKAIHLHQTSANISIPFSNVKK